MNTAVLATIIVTTIAVILTMINVAVLVVARRQPKPTPAAVSAVERNLLDVLPATAELVDSLRYRRVLLIAGPDPDNPDRSAVHTEIAGGVCHAAVGQVLMATGGRLLLEHGTGEC